MKRSVSCAALLLLTACSLDPFYSHPAAPVADTYPNGPAYRSETSLGSSVSADQIGWRDFFADPFLAQLIDIALRNNRDLRTAVLNIGVAQAQFRVQRADLFPSISVEGNAQYQGLPDSTVIPSPQNSSSTNSGVSSTAQLQPTSSKGGTFRYYTASLGFTSYELDLFGRVQSLSRQAFEQALSQEETRRSTQISLVGQVASAYLTWLGDQDLLKISRETFDSQSRSYGITKASLEAQ